MRWAFCDMPLTVDDVAGNELRCVDASKESAVGCGWLGDARGSEGGVSGVVSGVSPFSCAGREVLEGVEEVSASLETMAEGFLDIR